MHSAKSSFQIEVPLSLRQREIYLEHSLEPDAPIHNIGGYYWFNGPFIQDTFEQAVRDLISCNDALRLVLREQANDPFPQQCILPEVDSNLTVSQADSDADALFQMQQNLLSPFVMFGQPLYRFGVIVVSEHRWVFFMAFHHLIMDSAGITLTMARLAEIYQLGSPSSAGYPQFRDLLEDDKNYTDSAAYLRAGAYWKGREGKLTPPLFDRSRSMQHGENTAFVHEFDLSQELHDSLSKTADDIGAQRFHLLVGAISGYFSRLQGRDEITLGISLLNRGNAQRKNTIGLAASVAPIQIACDPDATLLSATSIVSTQLKQAYRFHRYPLSSINRDIGLHRSGRTRLFDLTISYLVSDFDHVMIGDAMSEGFLQIPLPFESKPLQIYINDMDLTRPLRISMVCNGTYFNRSSAATISEGLIDFLEHAVRHPTSSLFNIPSATIQEKQIVVDISNVSIPEVGTHGAHEIIEQVAHTYPDNTAVECDGNTLSYQALITRANQLAHFLQSNGVESNAVVAIFSERSIDMVVAILGIWKAGAAYLPLDPAAPAYRLEGVLQDAQADLVLTGTVSEAALEKLPASVTKLSISGADVDAMPALPLDKPCYADQLAYIIHTSGSTGKPKGVMVSHRGLSSLISAQKHLFGLSSGESILQFARLSFDASIWEIVMALSVGGRLVLTASEQLMPGAALAKTLKDNYINVATLPPSSLPFLNEYDLPSLRTVISAGEACPLPVAKHWTERTAFFNAYGPTETTVCASAGRYHGEDRVSIGRALSNSRLYVLDQRLMPVPAGVAGELYIAGPGLARGYIKQQATTSERFVANPFEVGTRMYRSGDFVRMQEDGSLEFIGRVDHQVKRNGFRIEPGEIENALLSHPGIQQATVIARDGADQSCELVAYVVPFETATPDTLARIDNSQIRAHLSRYLPDYMLPNHIVFLTHMPLNANGKVERSDLPLPPIKVGTLIGSEIAYGSNEEIITKIWSEVLAIPHIDRRANFFDLGGDSLRLARVLQLLNAKLSLKLAFVDLLRNPTISSLNDYILLNSSLVKTGSGSDTKKSGVLRNVLNRLTGQTRNNERDLQ